MKTRLWFVIGVLVTLGTALLFFSGCAQPPTEKVTSVQSSLKECVDKGAQLFVKDEYARIAMRANELQNLMDQKKYRKADALADSILAELPALKTAVETNGMKAAQQLAADVNDELGKVKGLLASADSKLLDKESNVTYNTLLGTFENEVDTLQKRLSDADFVGVYKAAEAIKGRMTSAEQEITQKIEQAKVIAAEKAKASKKTPVKKPPVKK